MSSVLRYVKPQTSQLRQFAVFGYRGGVGVNNFFTVQDNSLYRIENDLSGANYVIARDMGTSQVINSIDDNLISLWETEYNWTNIKVVRPGIARKFQCISMVQGDTTIGNGNSAAYLDTDFPICNYQGIGITVNDPLVIGNAETTVSNATNQNLPFGTFWAMNDPVVIEYEFSAVKYNRAIKNRIMETTYFGTTI